MTHLDATEMINDAERVTGLTDWDGHAFRQPFSILINSINEEAGLHELGFARAHQYLSLRLEQRLRMVEDRKRRPEISNQVIDRPIFVVGLPRAGTAYLHTLISRNPATLAPLHWQLLLPSPPPNDRSIDHTASIRQIKAMLEYQGSLLPSIKLMHEHGAELPEEDFLAFEFSFISTGFLGFFDVPGYVAKVLGGDFTPAYEWHRRTLQTMQVGAENRRWILKAPEHSMHLDTLLKVYPDAVIVQNHRDPSKVMASTFSLLSAIRANYTDRVQRMARPEALHFVQAYSRSLTHGIHLRADPYMNSRFLDVHYVDLESDPVGVVEQVHRHAGLAFTDQVRHDVQSWSQSHRKGVHGKHKYALADYGLTQEEVQAAFETYINRYGIQLESGA
jgi:Sulfotransferase family